MFRFNFEIFNFGKSLGKSGFDFGRTYKLSKNKSIEFQFTKFEATSLLNITIDLHWWGRDHAGPKFNIDVLGFYFGIDFYDSRHWNWDEGRWLLYDEEDE